MTKENFLYMPSKKKIVKHISYTNEKHTLEIIEVPIKSIVKKKTLILDDDSYKKLCMKNSNDVIEYLNIKIFYAKKTKEQIIKENSNKQTQKATIAYYEGKIIIIENILEKENDEKEITRLKKEITHLNRKKNYLENILERDFEKTLLEQDNEIELFEQQLQFFKEIENGNYSNKEN